jgi:invasion protein IalB
MQTVVYKVLFVGVLVGIGVSAALSQSPQRIAVTYDDWTVSCVAAPISEGKKSCEMVQSQTVHDQPNPVGQITISRPAKNEPFKIFFQVPANVWMQTGIKFTTDEKEPGLAATFKWCIPARCLAEADLSDTAVRKLRGRTEPAQVQFKDAAQHDISLPVSFKGYGPALDWMEKQ